MKSFVILCLLLICAKKSKPESVSVSLLATSVSAFLDDYFVAMNSSLSFIYYITRDRQKNGNTEGQKLINNLLTTKSLKTSMTIYRENQDNLTVTALYQPSILIFESLRQFDIVSRKVTWQPYSSKRLPHLVYVPNITHNDIQSIRDGFSIDKVNFPVQSANGSVELLSSFMFSPGKCKTNQVARINTFSRSMKMWKNKNFYPDKYSNFHGCKLTVLTPLPTDRMIDLLGPNLNLTRTYKVRHGREYFSAIFSEVFDLAVFMGVTPPHTMDSTSSLYSDEMVFWIPPGEPLTDFEKMILPFDDDTWICIFVTFVIALVVIQIINRCSTTVQNFMYGRLVKTPTLNVISTFLAGYQTQLPGTNFARFNTMLYIIWCLIFRTCYQSKMFEFLQVDLRHSMPQTFKELSEINLTVVADKLSCSLLDQLKSGGGDIPE